MGQPIKIYVGNIPPSARNSELKELFEKFGKVVECDILKEFAFVHMEDTNDAKAAIAGLNDSLWKGARIRVELSTTKTSKGEPSMRHRMPHDDRRRRGGSRDRDHGRGRSPPYRDYNPRFNGGPPYRSNDMRGPMRDSRYGGPPPRSRPYPEAYDRRGYPEPSGRPMPPRGGSAYVPEYPFHPSSYREPMRDHRGAYSDPYARGPPMGYGGPMPYYRGPPMPPPGRGYDYPPHGYPSSRPSRYSPPPGRSDMYRSEKGDYRGLSPHSNNRGSSRDDQPTFNGHRHNSPGMGGAGKSHGGSKRHLSSDNSHSPSPAPARRNGHVHKPRDAASYSRSPSPVAMSRSYRHNGHQNKHNKRSSSRSLSPPPNGNHRHHDSAESRTRSPSPIAKPKHRKSKEAKSKHASDGSSSNNSSINEANSKPARKHTNGHSKKSSISPVINKKQRKQRANSSSPSRSRSKSSNRSPIKA